jgi:hypothetical protein
VEFVVCSKYARANWPAVIPHQRMVDDLRSAVFRIWRKHCRTSPTDMFERCGMLRLFTRGAGAEEKSRLSPSLSKGFLVLVCPGPAI